MANCGVHSILLYYASQFARFHVFFFHWVGKVQFAFLMSIPTNKHTHDINRVNNKYNFYVVRVYLSFPPSPNGYSRESWGCYYYFSVIIFVSPGYYKVFFKKNINSFLNTLKCDSYFALMSMPYMFFASSNAI